MAIVNSFFQRVGNDISACNGDLSCALSMAGLDFTAQLERVFDARGNAIENSFNIARTDTGESLGVMGARYTITQTRDAFNYLRGMPGKANFRRGGMLKGGKFFLSAEFGVMDIRGDKQTAFGVFISSFDGSWANRPVWVFNRAACMNVATYVIKADSKRGAVKAKHTANHATKLDSLLFELQVAQDTVRTRAEKLMDSPMTRGEFDAFALRLIPGDSTRSENMRADLAAEFSNASRGTYGKNRFDAFNALTAYETHVATRRETETGTRDENAFAALIGANETISTRGLAELLN